MSESLSEVWEAVAPDPDTHGDLDYELRPLTMIELGTGAGGGVMILPGEEEQLLEDEYMVAERSCIRQLDDCR